MRLASLSIRNFRPFREEVTIPIDDLTVLIGQNDVGKSSILDALAMFFGEGSVKPDAEDCNVNSGERVIEIACEFEDLPTSIVLDDDVSTNFQSEYLLTDQQRLKIKKRLDFTGAKLKQDVYVCAIHPTAFGYDNLLSLTNTQLKERLKTLGVSAAGIDLRKNPELRRAIWGACPDLELQQVDISANKEDAKRLWEKIVAFLPSYALFRSDRPSQDTDAEVQDPMKLAIAAAIAEVQPDLDKVEKTVRDKAEELARRTHEALARIDKNAAAQLSPDFKGDIKWNSVFSITLRTDNGIPLGKRGSGLRRLVLLSFLMAEAERRRTEQVNSSIIYAVEEPETSQHPHNQKMLVQALQELAEDDGCQVLLTTHSPGLATLIPIQHFRFIDHDYNGSTSIRYGDESVYGEVVDSLGIVPDNRIRVLICVEGPTDVENLRVLSHLLHEQDPNLPDLGLDPRVALVPLGGGTLKHWVERDYLGGLNRPQVHIYDGDVDQYKEACDKINSRGDGSWAAQTKKREIENYIHSQALYDAFGITVQVGDMDDVGKLVGDQIGCRCEKAKKRISQEAFPKMTAAMLDERDPEGEIKGWLCRIKGML